MDKLRTVRGVNDLLPEVLDKHNQVIETALKISNQYCYSQIETPIFEFSEIFKKPLGISSDIVTKENYIFKDRSDDELMLRPEGTSGVVRAFLNAGLIQDVPKRFSYYGPMFRYERPQKGRLRQFKQFGVECIGLSNPMADVEVISLGKDFLLKLGLLNSTKLKINSLGDSESRLNYRKFLIEYLNDYKTELSNDSINRLSQNPLRILDSKNESDRKIIFNAPNILDYLNQESKDKFQIVTEGLDVLGIKYDIDKNLVRGLDYYCHTAFEFITDELGAQGTVLAGGRYDGLSKMLGGPDTPGVGWAAGIERLSLLVPSYFSNNPDVVLLGVSDEFNFLLLSFMEPLIKADLKVEILYTGSMSKKFKRANKINASFAIILGEEEVKMKILKLKNLITGTEETVNIREAVNVIKTFLNK
ncbi:histidine--tRNA ligase [Alphaproteobacteria bacterium]|nr:histidine--tRNA ligase [Alphaproteobacteria bacterium]